MLLSVCSTTALPGWDDAHTHSHTWTHSALQLTPLILSSCHTHRREWGKVTAFCQDFVFFFPGFKGSHCWPVTPNTREAIATGSRVPGQSVLHSKTLSQNIKKWGRTWWHTPVSPAFGGRGRKTSGSKLPSWTQSSRPAWALEDLSPKAGNIIKCQLFANFYYLVKFSI